jgi:tripartite-type tricarboxylate transporter receptor subunit TctC
MIRTVAGRRTRRSFPSSVTFGVATLVAALCSTAALAQAWPAKPVRIVVPFGAGGAQDTMARSMSTELGQLLGTSVIVENRVGAGGTIATAYVAKQPADGYTLIMAAASHTINGTLYPKLEYYPLRDFTAIAPVAYSGYVVVASGNAPFASIQELVTYGKANPGKLNYSTAGVGSAGHLSGAFLLSLAGVDAVHVPTKGMGDAATEVLAGRCDLTVLTNNIALPYLNDKRMRFLGVTTTTPSRFVPGVAPVSNTLKGYEFGSWFGFLGPAGVPKAVVDRINAAATQLVKQPEVAERLVKQGAEPLSMPPEQFADYLKADFAKMARVVKASGAKAE